MTSVSQPEIAPLRKTPISVALVEDDLGLRDSLGILLNGTPGFRCVGAYGSAGEALEKIISSPPDVVLMDIQLPDMSGIACVRQLKNALPRSRILMLTNFAQRDNIFQALRAGASGYLSKRTTPAELLKALETVQAGGAPMSSDVAARIVAYFNQAGDGPGLDTRLSPRETQILELLSQGYLYKEIADQLDVSFSTVQWHIRNIYEKLHVRSRSEAIALHLRR
jgi:DNA-binding NarL/FixJ family response regulator